MSLDPSVGDCDLPLIFEDTSQPLFSGLSVHLPVPFTGIIGASEAQTNVTTNGCRGCPAERPSRRYLAADSSLHSFTSLAPVALSTTSSRGRPTMNPTPIEPFT